MMKLFLLVALSSLAMSKTTTNVRPQRISGPKGYFSNQAIFGSKGVTVDTEEPKDIFEINQNVPHLNLPGGDMVPSKEQKNAITTKSRFWPDATIPVSLSPYLNALGIAGVDEAIHEYELRTCLRLPWQTNEADYIYVDSQGGCWSSVGIVGGQQTVSLGSGCERMGIAIHEIMHAAGIQHEQCRTDRDDYITVAEENINSGLLYNFDKYSYEQIDTHEVPYDYYSVMHYSDTSFSINGEKTIVSKDPKYQSVMGQRFTFSEGDVALINSMYSCAEPARVSYKCFFEENTVCGYAQDRTDDIDWIRYTIDETDGSSISSNIPRNDTTYGQPGKGSFMLLDTSSNAAANIGNLESMRLKSNYSYQCLEFSYYMDLNANSGASLDVQLATIDQTTGDIISTKSISKLSGDHGNNWNIERVTLTAPGYYKLVFSGRSGGYANDVIAIDDVNVKDRYCDSTYFVINDFSKLVAESEPEDYIYSPLLQDERGYSFRIQVYPNGRSYNSPGYIGVYFVMAQGEKDDQLSWPFYNRIIKTSIVDQNPDTVVRMDYSYNYITSSSGGDWSKPTSELNTPYGYSRFITLDEIYNGYNYLKNDALMISIDVRDMSYYYASSKSQSSKVRNANPQPFEMPSSEEHGLAHGHEHHQENHDINVNVHVSHEQDQHEDKHEETKNDESASTSLVAGIIIACSLGVLVVMGLVMIVMNQTHKQAIKAMSLANSRLSEQNGRNNLGYAEGKA